MAAPGGERKGRGGREGKEGRGEGGEEGGQGGAPGRCAHPPPSGPEAAKGAALRAAERGRDGRRTAGGTHVGAGYQPAVHATCALRTPGRGSARSSAAGPPVTQLLRERSSP